MNLHGDHTLRALQARSWPANDGGELTFTRVLGELVAAHEERTRVRGVLLAVCLCIALVLLTRA